MSWNFGAIFQNYITWASSTFDKLDPRSPEIRHAGCLKHAVKEIAEIAAEPTDAAEYFDAIAMVVFAARLKGISLDDIALAGISKMGELQHRQWQQNPDGTIGHVKPST